MEGEKKKAAPIILYCAGNANVGQMTQAVAFDLSRRGVGRLVCLAGIGARLKGFLKTAVEAEETILFDGCEIGCGKKILADNGLPLAHYFVMTQHGLQKSYELGLPQEEVHRVSEAVLKSLPDKLSASFPMAGSRK
jgi:uncharacterized metal-binding protein